MRSRSARRAAYEARNPPSIVRHLAQAFVGKTSAYTESTQYAVGENGARELVNASMFTNSSGFFKDYDDSRFKQVKRPEEKKNASMQSSDSQIPDNEPEYPHDLRPDSTFSDYRPRGTRSTRLSVRQDGPFREWQR